MIGQVLSERYRVDELLGEGGFGAVYRGTQLGLERPVAIKVLRRELAADQESIERFLREAEAVANLRHPNVVQIIDVSVSGAETPYLVMELLEGRPLSRVLTEEGSLPLHRAVQMARQILSALSVAHAAGVVHRDIKPPNVFLGRDHEGKERWTLLDFGIAKLTDSPEYHRLTATGRVMGTPRFMSPEQASGGAVDGRSDLHSVGTLLHATITGRKPFDGLAVGQILPRLIAGDIAPVETFKPDVDSKLSRVIERAMAPNPNDRYQSAEELRDALAPFEGVARPVEKTVASIPPGAASQPPPSQSQPPARGKPRGFLLGAIGIGVILAGGAAVATWAVFSSGEPGREVQRVEPVPVIPAVPTTAEPLVPMLPSGMVPLVPSTQTPPSATGSADAGAEIDTDTEEVADTTVPEPARRPDRPRPSPTMQGSNRHQAVECTRRCMEQQMECVRLPPAERPMCLGEVSRCRYRCQQTHGSP